MHNPGDDGRKPESGAHVNAAVDEEQDSEAATTTIRDSDTVGQRETSPDPRLAAFHSADAAFSDDDDDEVFLADNKAEPEPVRVHQPQSHSKNGQSEQNEKDLEAGRSGRNEPEVSIKPPRTIITVRPPSPDLIVAMDDDGPSGSGVRESGIRPAIDGSTGPGRPRRVCGTGSSAASSSSDSETADDAPLLAGSSERSQPVRIEMPGEKPASPHDRFPKERGKAIACTILLVFAAVFNTIVLSYVHEKLPDDPPLPDIVFDHTPYFPLGLDICEYLMMVSFASVLLLMLFHRHRWIMLRRLTFIGSLLYLMRCVTMLSTQVPKADKNWHCAPKYGENATFWNVVWRGIEIVTGVGLNVQGRKTLCGDYIYSGHTIVLVCSALFMGEYSPRRWRIVHALYWLAAIVGGAFLVVSRGHYTIDVILSYFICTRMFWVYHTMAANPTLRMSSHNHHRKEYWFYFFHYLERSVMKPVPRYENSKFTNL
ncbi:hypothetical protein WR25_23162 isoform G [Diploscapter pachys]|uniref:Sphingomyelin synthase-like domain-containing protein n=1 Tax=Diploscapter pachys TaxID=2018661 RepID=A0A2A2M004_9BILA|nr:hypothetical protein WR25_23162 isoform G [Diploscapter pachys]